ncbi:hypothetical protein IFM53868_09446 [Aspergillus udagawae]|uniref:Uncharacterized protein n=1 Tax=Aspergillus udagawae TaxID=91492 RepID=A0ABQ1BBJ8_9EURO|nr:hypothetical protein IFM53868_09446 [Aspergillus udagawae]
MDPLGGRSDDAYLQWQRHAASVNREANDRRRPTERPMMANVERLPLAKWVILGSHTWDVDDQGSCGTQ